MKIQEYVDIKQYSTLKVGGQFRYLTVVSEVLDLKEACTFAKENNLKILILGYGSNIVFSDGILEVLAIKNDSKDYVDIKVGAGEIWDDIVSRTVDMGLSGFELLSSIPGTVGAGPVQNIGAYGSEIKDTLIEVEVYGIETNMVSNISNVDCKFGYRDSIFKNEMKGKYIITAVHYRLSKSIKLIPDYPGVQKYLEENNINTPTLKQIRNAIISIRKEKLPNPIETPNVGSFFKNPIVLNEVAYRIIEEFPNAKFFALKDDLTKIPAGWLIENAGLKGESFGAVSIYDKNALVLVNNGGANCEDILKARDEIVRIVNDKFGIILEQEPETI